MPRPTLYKFDFQATPHAPKVRQLLSFKSLRAAQDAAEAMTSGDRVVTCVGPLKRVEEGQ